MAIGLSGCGNTGDSASTTAPGGGDAEPARSDVCKTLEFKDVEAGGEFVDYAQLASGGDNTSFDPGMVQTQSPCKYGEMIRWKQDIHKTGYHTRLMDAITRLFYPS